MRCFLLLSALLGEGKGKNKTAAERKEDDSQRGHISTDTRELRDGAKDKGWDQKHGSGSNTSPPAGGGRFQGAARGRKVGWSRALPAAPGLQAPSPLPELQPPLPAAEQELRLSELVNTRTQGSTPGHGGRWRAPGGTVAAPNRR